MSVYCIAITAEYPPNTMLGLMLLRNPAYAPPTNGGIFAPFFMIQNPKSLLITTATLIVTLLIIHLVATEYFLYWKLRSLDIVMHFLGGIFVGLSTLYLIFYRGIVRENIKDSASSVFFVALIGIFLVGGFWEVFEYTLDSVTVAYGGDKLLFGSFKDTIGDLASDIAGSLFASLLYIKLWRIA